MPLADRVIRASMVLTVITVASIAAIVSWNDIHELVIWFGGEHGFIAIIFPLCIDGIIAAANLTLLFCSRYHLDPPRFVRLVLWAGIWTTLAANICRGIPYGWPAAVIGAWPALSLVMSTEVLWWTVASARELDKREIVVYEKQPEGSDLNSVLTVLANDRSVSAAEVARQTGLPYGKTLDLTKQARRLLNGSHLSVIG